MRARRTVLAGGPPLAMLLVVLTILLSQQRGATTAAAVARTPSPSAMATFTATATPPGPTATPLPPLVVASRPVPAGTRLEGPGSFAAYFKEQPPLGLVPADAVPGFGALQSPIMSNTVVVGAIAITADLRRGSVLRYGDFRVIRFSPPGSLAYHIGVGRVALSIQLPPLAADNGVILPGDSVDLLMTIRQHETDSLGSNPPASTQSGAMETQQLLQDVRVLAVAPQGIYTLELPLQEALIVKYARDSVGLVDLALEPAEAVRTGAPQATTNPVYPELFLTPVIVQGTPVAGATPMPSPAVGVPFAFTPSRPTPTTQAAAPPSISVQPSSPFQSPGTPVPTGVVIHPIINP